MKTRQQITTALLLVLLAGFLAGSYLPAASVAVSALDPWARMHPALRQVARDSPEQTVRAIVRYSGDGQKIADRVVWLGGTILQELPIISSLVARVPAASLSDLASLASVQWLSPDAGMISSTSENELVYTTWASELGYPTEALARDFRNHAIPVGSSLWFNTVVKTKNLPSSGATVRLENVSIQFEVGDASYQVELPDSTIRYTASSDYASTYYEWDVNSWITTAPKGFDKEVFATGAPFAVETALPGGIKNVRARARVTSTTPGVEVEWKWAAATYSKFSSELNDLGVKPVHKNEAASSFADDRPAGTPENFRLFLTSGGTGDGGSNFTGDYATRQPLIPGFVNSAAMAQAIGPDDQFAEGGVGLDAVKGFQGEFTPGYVISKVELVIRGYTNSALGSDVKADLSLDGWNKSFDLKKALFTPVVGVNGEVALDVTSLRTWHWTDFANGLLLRLDQTGLSAGQKIYYDGVGLRVTSVPGTSDQTVKMPEVRAGRAIKLDKLGNAFPYAIRAADIWNQSPAHLQGQGVTIAVVDSGIGKSKSLSRNFLDVNFNREYRDGKDKYGHGTFVAMLAAGDGKGSGNRYIGVAPGANLLNVRVTNDQGMTTEATVIEALQWVLLNKDVYKIRVVNLSLNSSVAQSYHTSPLSAATEILWFNGIVVVVSAGNNGTSTLYPPANDPFVLTVGATDDRGTPGKGDDTMAAFSAYGFDEMGQAKPDLVAPGRNLVTYVPSNDRMTMGEEHPENRQGKELYRMSGTSMAAPMVAGAVAILLQDEPNLTPDQVKARLKSTADKSWGGYDPLKSGAGYLDIYAAVHGVGLESANSGLIASQLLWTGTDPVAWSSVNWNSVNWNSVNWNSVNWNSVNWNSVNWNSDFWGDVDSASTVVPFDASKQPTLFLPLVGN